MMESIDALFCWLNLLENKFWKTGRDGRVIYTLQKYVLLDYIRLWTLVNDFELLCSVNNCTSWRLLLTVNTQCNICESYWNVSIAFNVTRHYM